MRIPFGRLALLGSIAAWTLEYGALLAGGLDPPARQVASLSGAVTIAAALSLVSIAAGIAALVVKRQRPSAAAGLAIALLFVLAFTGWLFVPFSLGR
jgi:hypothetical protein